MLKTLNPFIEKERKPDKYRANTEIVTPPKTCLSMRIIQRSIDLLRQNSKHV